MGGKKDQPETDEKPVKKSGGLIGNIITAICAGVAAFATIYFLPSDEPAVIEAAHVEDAEKHHEEPEAEPVETTFVAMSPIVVSVGRNDGLRHLKIGLSFEAPYDQVEMIETKEPKLRDVFMSYLRAIESEDLEDPAFMNRLRSQLERRASTVLGKSSKSKILITDFILT